MDRIIFKEVEETETLLELEEEPQEGELTVIHFVTTPNTNKFKLGWWVNVIPKIFIRPLGTWDRLGLVYAHNIPVAPQKYYFDNATEELHFTLFFPPLPKGTTHINIIEKVCGGTERYFNFARVSLAEIKSAPLRK